MFSAGSWHSGGKYLWETREGSDDEVWLIFNSWMINDCLLFICSKTFSLGSQEHFNVKNGLNETHTNFTYLVPSDQAWEDIRKEHSSVYKVRCHLSSSSTEGFTSLFLDSLHGRLLLSDTPRAWETFESWIEDVPERHGQYCSVKYSDVKGSFYYRYRPQRLGMGWRWCEVPLWRWQPLWWMEVRERERSNFASLYHFIFRNCQPCQLRRSHCSDCQTEHRVHQWLHPSDRQGGGEGW